MTVDDKTLRTTLRELGRTGTGVRRSLQTAGITGKPEDGETCAVAQYLRNTFPDEIEIVVDAQSVKVNGAEVSTNKAISDFIEKFDEREYPELLEHTEGCTGPAWDRPDWEWYERCVECDCGVIYRSFDGDEKDKARRFYKAAVDAWKAAHPETVQA